MSQPHPQRGGTSIASRIALRWSLAALTGMTLAVTAILCSPLSHEAPAVQATVAIAGGWLAVLVFAPWRETLLISGRCDRIRLLCGELHEISRGTRRRLTGARAIARDEELRDLIGALENLIARAGTDRRTAHALRRTMRDRIRHETEKATGSLKRQAITDPLTGLGNRRALDRWLTEILADRRKRGEIAVMVLDMDLFKNINDALGHDAGDECLRFLGRLLSSALRHEDRAARLGGDEFVILMPDASLPQAQRIAQRLSSLFGQMPWPHTQVPRPTLSVGLAVASREEQKDGPALLRRADDALYESKRRGGNAVSTAA